MFPTWTHSFINPFLWSSWKCKSYIRKAKYLLAPKAIDLLQRSDDSRPETELGEENNGLTWFAETAKGDDRNSERIANLELILAFAGVHTTLIRMVSVLYDLIAHPDLIVELREEISEAQQGGWCP